MNNIPQLVDELKRQRDQIDRAIAAISPLVGNGFSRGRRDGKRHLSAAARARIAAAQRARWAKLKGAGTVNSRTSTRPKRTISAAGRRRIAAAQRVRWAKAKQAAK